MGKAVRYGVYFGIPLTIVDAGVDLLYRSGVLGGPQGASTGQSATVGVLSIAIWLLATIGAGAAASRPGTRGPAALAGFLVVAIDQARNCAMLIAFGPLPGPALAGPGAAQAVLPLTPGLILLGTVLVLAFEGPLGAAAGMLGGRLLGPRRRLRGMPA